VTRRYYPPTESDIPMHGWRPYSDVHRERIRAHDKHDSNGDSMERKAFTDVAWLSVLVEEVGEVAKALCDHRHHGEYSDPAALAAELRGELVQVAAMTVAWIDAIDQERP
jgi:NTP pyrophosphatase (non-canonical NTP hydrolase)